MSKGGLAFLNKKSWHTGLPKNIEKTWLAEQASAAEQKKIAELQAERTAEYELEQLRQLQRQNGHTCVPSQSTHGLDWMYKGAVQTDSDRHEAALLGQKVDVKPSVDDKSKIDKVIDAQPVGALFANSKILDNKVEQMNRLRDDPLTAIMKQQVAVTGGVPNGSTASYYSASRNEDVLKQLERVQRKLRKERKKLERERKKRKHKRHASSSESDGSDRSGHTSRSASKSRSPDRRSRSRSPGQRSSDRHDRDAYKYNDKHKHYLPDRRSDKYAGESEHRSRSRSPVHSHQPVVKIERTAGLQLPQPRVQPNGVKYGLQPNTAAKHDFKLPAETRSNGNADTRNNRQSEYASEYARSSDRYDERRRPSEHERLEQMRVDALNHNRRRLQRADSAERLSNVAQLNGESSRNQAYKPTFVTDMSRNVLDSKSEHRRADEVR